jgi:hypothetical protein
LHLPKRAGNKKKRRNFEMTQHTPEVQALIDALKDAREYVSSESCMERIDIALAALTPKPEKVYVLPTLKDRMPEQIAFCKEWGFYDDGWNTLRELTAIEPPAQKWNMPEWNEVETSDECFFFGPPGLRVTEGTFNAFRDKIMAMNN